jgi:peptidoglycan/xylan/chitin deacetylase (PgdA/CDA1 family)
MEVVLTFDDGPIPWITRSILDTLDRYCTKATFFSVGRMAIAYPASVKDVLARGHTLGTHTWSHPLSLKHLGLERAKDEIERGFAAVAMAAGQPIAPFFRFPGLSDSDPLLAHLQTRGIASFTVDVVSNDSYIGSADRLARHTLGQIAARKGGILLFHDIKAATAKALPAILAGLVDGGYKVVHLRAKAPVVPLNDYASALAPMLAKSQAVEASGKAALVPFYGPSGSVAPESAAAEPAVTVLAPAARVRTAAEPHHRPRKSTPEPSVVADDGVSPVHKKRHHHRHEQPATFFD